MKDLNVNKKKTVMITILFLNVYLYTSQPTAVHVWLPLKRDYACKCYVLLILCYSKQASFFFMQHNFIAACMVLIENTVVQMMSCKLLAV